MTVDAIVAFSARRAVSLLRPALLVFVLAVFGGCTAYRPVEMPPGGARAAIDEQAAVQPGDRVRLTLTDGERVEFRVVEIRDERLIGESVEVPFDAIETIESRELSKARTAGAAGGLTLGTVLLLLAGLSTMAFMP